jgi:hypothetical protein
MRDGPERPLELVGNLLMSMDRGGLADCSLLTILLAGNRVSCIDESQKDASVGGSLPYLWRKTR